MLWLNAVIAFFAVIVMLYSIFTGMKLLKVLKGGVVKKRLTYLTGLLYFFLIGYAVTPFYMISPENDLSVTMIFLVFLFGAFFVYFAISTIEAILKVSGIVREK